MAKKKGKSKKARKNKYAEYSKIEDNPKIMSYDVPKEERIKAAKSYKMANEAVKIYMPHVAERIRRGKKRFCKTCLMKIIFHMTRNHFAVCSCCGFKIGETKDEKKL